MGPLWWSCNDDDDDDDDDDDGDDVLLWIFYFILFWHVSKSKDKFIFKEDWLIDWLIDWLTVDNENNEAPPSGVTDPGFSTSASVTCMAFFLVDTETHTDL